MSLINGKSSSTNTSGTFPDTEKKGELVLYLRAVPGGVMLSAGSVIPQGSVKSLEDHIGDEVLLDNCRSHLASGGPWTLPR